MDKVRLVAGELSRDGVKLIIVELEVEVVRYTVMLLLLDLNLKSFKSRRMLFRFLVPVTLRVIVTAMVTILRHLVMLTMVDMADVIVAVSIII